MKKVAKKIGAGGLALDEARLRQLAPHRQIVLIWPKKPRPDGIDDPDRPQPHLGGDAAIPHLVQPAACFFLEGFVKVRLARHGYSVTAAAMLRQKLPARKRICIMKP